MEKMREIKPLKADRWLLWSKKYNKKKNSSSRALFEGVKHQ